MSATPPDAAPRRISKLSRRASEAGTARKPKETQAAHEVSPPSESAQESWDSQPAKKNPAVEEQSYSEAEIIDAQYRAISLTPQIETVRSQDSQSQPEHYTTSLRGGEYDSNHASYPSAQQPLPTEAHMAGHSMATSAPGLRRDGGGTGTTAEGPPTAVERGAMLAPSAIEEGRAREAMQGTKSPTPSAEPELPIRDARASKDASQKGAPSAATAAQPSLRRWRKSKPFVAGPRGSATASESSIRGWRRQENQMPPAAFDSSVKDVLPNEVNNQGEHGDGEPPATSAHAANAAASLESRPSRLRSQVEHVRGRNAQSEMSEAKAGSAETHKNSPSVEEIDASTGLNSFADIEDSSFGRWSWPLLP